MREQLVLDMSPGQIWAGSDYVLLPLRWETMEGCDSSQLVVEVFRDSECYEFWLLPEDLFSEFPGARRLA
jgi:hypothetical protein